MGHARIFINISCHLTVDYKKRNKKRKKLFNKKIFTFSYILNFSSQEDASV
jgi:hypothetical protein